MTESTTNGKTLHLALELSSREWKLGFSGGTKRAG